jgi:ACR3 family arsenite efflux pump ArsB
MDALRGLEVGSGSPINIPIALLIWLMNTPMMMMKVDFAAIALFGPASGAALATVVGVLIEVPVMLSVCAVCTRTRHWFPEPQGVLS